MLTLLPFEFAVKTHRFEKQAYKFGEKLLRVQEAQMIRKTLVRWQDGTYDNELLLPEEKCGGEHYREIITKKSYVDYAAEKGLGDADESRELSAANPDVIEEAFNFGPGEAHPRASRIIMTQAVKSLTAEQLQVWKLCMSSKNPKSETQAARILGISQPAIHYRLAGAIKRVTEFCESHLDLIKEDDSL
jgi:DNA-binding CsgD family transcriptional regulator